MDYVPPTLSNVPCLLSWVNPIFPKGMGPGYRLGPLRVDLRTEERLENSQSGSVLSGVWTGKVIRCPVDEGVGVKTPEDTPG